MNIQKMDNKKLNVILLPSIIALIVFIIGFVVIEYSNAYLQMGQLTNGLILLAFGGILTIFALLWWGGVTYVQLLRVEVNELKKLP